MRILFDQGTPVPLSEHLKNHAVETVFQRGWSLLENGELLAMAEESFDLFITTDQQLQYQQNLKGRKLMILVLMTTSWPRINAEVKRVIEIIDQMRPGSYTEIRF